MAGEPAAAEPRSVPVSVVIPARDAAGTVGRAVRAVLAQAAPALPVEVLVVDDGSRDDTAAVAALAGARVVRRETREARGGPPAGNPAAARNLGAARSVGDPIVFLDADCVPEPGWLAALLAAHAAGAAIVGGALAPGETAALTARCSYYCGAYHLHPRRPAGEVPNHTPANLSVRRAVFERSGGFTETLPVADGHEELAWQARARAAGVAIRFEPRAVVRHHDRRGLGQLLRRNYRWGYSALEGKAASGAARWARAYRRPWLLLALSLPLAPLAALYTVACWLRSGVREPLALFPLVLAARTAYAIGFMWGGARWALRLPARPAHAR